MSGWLGGKGFGLWQKAEKGCYIFTAYYIIHVILLWSTKKQQTRRENDMNKESGSQSPSCSSGTGTTRLRVEHERNLNC